MEMNRNLKIEKNCYFFRLWKSDCQTVLKNLEIILIVNMKSFEMRKIAKFAYFSHNIRFWTAGLLQYDSQKLNKHNSSLEIHKLNLKNFILYKKITIIFLNTFELDKTFTIFKISAE